MVEHPDKPEGSEQERHSHRDRGSVSIPDPAERQAAPDPPPFVRAIRQAAPVLAAAWTLTAALLLGAGGGYLLDGKLGTAPWLAVTGTFLGMAVGLYQLARVMLGRGTR